MNPSLHITAVVATRNRPESLDRTLASWERGGLPEALRVVDASEGEATRAVVQRWADAWSGRVSVQWMRAEVAGAAPQRNQGVRGVDEGLIWFADDDILLEPGCLVRLRSALAQDPGLGGVNAFITNQHYRRPGRASSAVYRLLAGKPLPTYAGKVIGPALNFLPDDATGGPEAMPVDWLNTTCTLYRREVLPEPVFPPLFTGYSLGEDLMLSLWVAKRWRLATVRSARIYHDSQPGSHKSDLRVLARMGLTNRYYTLRQVLGRRGFRVHTEVLVWEVFQCLVALRRPAQAWRSLLGCWDALPEIRRIRRASP